MSKQVFLTLSYGNFEQGYAASLRIQDDAGGTIRDIYQVSGRLPSSACIDEKFTQWQECFHTRVRQATPVDPGNHSRGKPGKVIKKSHISDLSHAALQLAAYLNEWLNSGDRDWRKIRDGIQQNLGRDEDIRFIIQAEDSRLWQLPWQAWDMLAKYYPKSEIGLSPAEASPPMSPAGKLPSEVRILAVLGRSEQIDIDFDIKVLDDLCSKGANLEFLNKPGKNELLDHLWDTRGWDIFFFAGHSESPDRETGLIHLNRHESIKIDDFKNAVRAAIGNGLQIAVFNSCDGLANQLVKLYLPHCIVMREPVPDLVAREFLKNFLTGFSEGLPFYTSVREAREKLEDAWNDRYPGAGWLPVICQNPTVYQPTWNELQGRKPAKIKTGNQYKRFFTVCVIAVLAVAVAVRIYPGIWVNMMHKAKVFIWETGRGSAPEQPGEWIEPVTGMVFVRIHGGCCKMGCDTRTVDNCPSNETPLHTVCVDGFRMGKHKVTQGQWKNIMGTNPSAFDSCGDDCPVEMVSWDDTQEFIKKLNKKTGRTYRLPTEAEWEYVCRGIAVNTPEHGPGVPDLPDYMWEWCEDAFIKDAYRKHKTGNPLLKEISDRYMVIRGGSLSDKPRCGYRLGNLHHKPNADIGFRVVRLP
ncbi:MAG: SUMF1/EgtB/PvdO family nonheme iron enzyme [Desulfobacterales bacterium]|nr:SUMF1/EgtB/PvdO family nonheme iron enzyme [Desulfobacterales bacterium]